MHNKHTQKYLPKTICKKKQLDGVLGTQTSRGTYYSLTTVVEATALLFVEQHVKGAIINSYQAP